MSGDTAARDIEAAYAATRRILRARTVDEAQEALLGLCQALGATVVDAEHSTGEALPLDLSLDDSGPLLPVATSDAVRSAVTRYLTAAVSDARTVLDRNLRSERLVESATRDPLTGLWNRRALTMAINRARPGDCIAMVDLDHFKKVNDTLGHDAGDDVLMAFGAHLRSGLRDRDVVGRLGGEEFVIVFPSSTLDEAAAALQRLRESWRDASPQPVSFSAGVARVGDTTGPVHMAGQVALQSADAASYRAKSEGRDRIVVADAQGGRPS